MEISAKKLILPLIKNANFSSCETDFSRRSWLHGFSYVFTGPCWRMPRVSSLQRSCASLVTQAAQEKRKRGLCLLLTDI